MVTGAKSYTYPFIADKQMYAAVRYACNMIRDTGWFHKAVSTAAKKYGVSESGLEAEIRKRQSAGQKAKPKSTVSMKWWLVEKRVLSERDCREEFYLGIKQGASVETITKTLNKLARDEESQYAGMAYGYIIDYTPLEQCQTKSEAQSKAHELLDGKHKYVGVISELFHNM